MRITSDTPAGSWQTQRILNYDYADEGYAGAMANYLRKLGYVNVNVEGK
jgi:hypothetical protein